MEMPRSIVPVPGFEKDSYDWQERHAAKLAWVKENRADVIFFGDSLTHFWTAENGDGHSDGLWQELFSGEKVLNLGYGYDRTQNVLWRIANGEVADQDPNMIVVNIGTNQFSITPNYDGDDSETAFAGVKLLIETLEQKYPRAEILVMAVFPRLPEETTQKSIDGLNALLKEYLTGRNKDSLKFIDITKAMRNPDGSFNPAIYVDGACHPTNAGYRIWAEALEPEIRRILAAE